MNDRGSLSHKYFFESCQLPQFPLWVPPSFVVGRSFFLCICLVIGLFGAKTDYFCEAVSKKCIIHSLRSPSKSLSARVMIGWIAVTRRAFFRGFRQADPFSICINICWPVGFQFLLAWWFEVRLIFYKYNWYFRLWLGNSTFIQCCCSRYL